jgi:hypothetical protein
MAQMEGLNSLSALFKVRFGTTYITALGNSEVVFASAESSAQTRRTPSLKSDDDDGGSDQNYDYDRNDLKS